MSRREGYRYRRGEAHPRAKHSDDDRRLMRELHDEGLGYGTIAKKFDTNRYTVRHVVNRSR